MIVGGSNNSYPGSALSNFTARFFVFEGIPCYSIEGVLQAFKSPYPHVQEEICKLVGIAAKKRGSKIDWKKEQKLYWKGVEYRRDSVEYQDLLDRLYITVFNEDPKFRKALIDAGKDAVFKHPIGKNKMSETVLTQYEFCSRLMRLKDLAMKGEQNRLKCGEAGL